MWPLLAAACSRLQPEYMPVVWHAAASIVRDCSMEASSASAPFWQSWNARLMSDMTMGTVPVKRHRGSRDTHGTRTGHTGAPVKRHRVEPGPDTGPTRDTRAHGHTDHTDEPHKHVKCLWVAFVCCCFACDCVLELVCRAMVSGPVRACVLSVVRLRFGRRTSQPSKPKDTPARATRRDGRNRGRLNSRRPGADRSCLLIPATCLLGSFGKNLQNPDRLSRFKASMTISPLSLFLYQ